MKLKKIVALGLAITMGLTAAACGSPEKQETGGSNTEVPTIDQITVGEDYKDLEASIKILTDRTDIVDTVYKGYAEEFMDIYPNIDVTYEAVTDYSEAITLRLTTGDWGDICYIPVAVSKKEMPEYFMPLGEVEKLDDVYNFIPEKSYDGQVYGIANGGTADGIVYNKKIWEEAGIKELPKTPDEFLEALQTIKDNTDAIPLYTNFSAGWTMGQWDAYINIAATGDPDFKNITLPHMKDPFARTEDMTGPYAVYYVLYEAVARGLIEEDPASSDWESSKIDINKGEIASMVLGSWAVEQCRQSGDAPEDIGYMPFPITVNGTQYAGAGGNYSFAINNKASSDNQIASLIYLKWLLEESTIYSDEGSIPALKNADMPEVLSGFADTELLSNNPAEEGEEDLFDDVNNESEIGIAVDDYMNCLILESALYGTKTLDELMDEWNQKWTAAQESLGVEIR